MQLPKNPVTVELSSIASANPHSVLEAARETMADAYNLPDGILGRLTIDPIVLASKVKLATDRPVLAHLTCRDTTRLGLASRLLGAGALGVDGVLALTGDAGSKNVFELRSVELVALIAELNAGQFASKTLASPTKLTISVAANPNIPEQIEHLKKKVAAGAELVQTQPIFDSAKALEWLAAVRQAGITIPILLGIMPLKSVQVAEYFNKNVVGVTVPEPVLERLRVDPAAGLQIALELSRQLKGKVDGVHLMPLGRTDWSNQIYDFFKAS